VDIEIVKEKYYSRQVGDIVIIIGDKYL